MHVTVLRLIENPAVAKVAIGMLLKLDAEWKRLDEVSVSQDAVDLLSCAGLVEVEHSAIVRRTVQQRTETATLTVWISGEVVGGFTDRQPLRYRLAMAAASSGDIPPTWMESHEQHPVLSGRCNPQRIRLTDDGLEYRQTLEAIHHKEKQTATFTTDLKNSDAAPTMLKVVSSSITIEGIPAGMALCLNGDIVLREELSEDRPSGEWARICGVGDDSIRHRFTHNRPGATWRVVDVGNQRYRIHVEDLQLCGCRSLATRLEKLNPREKK